MISRAIRARANHMCEGSPAFPECRAANGQAHPVTGSKVVLTVAHLDHQSERSLRLARLALDPGQSDVGQSGLSGGSAHW